MTFESSGGTICVCDGTSWQSLALSQNKNGGACGPPLRFVHPLSRSYLTSTVAPASSNCALI
jgi:hypothetical protein